MRFQSAPLVVAAGAALIESVGAADCPKAKNFIYVVPDGYGIASQVMARDFYSIINGEGTVDRPNSIAIGVDSMIIGSIRTQSSDNLVPDSAATGTAFACGVKTYNAAIGVDDDGNPVGSVLESAHRLGLKTGLVVTSRITHATPASYASHVLHRDSETEIAAQEIGYSHPFGSVVDLLMGGGRGNFLPRSAGGSRDDGVDLVEWAQGEGFTYAADKSDFDELLDEGLLPLPFLGLFARSHMDYEIDRNPETQPSLLEMATVAVDTLNAAAEAEDGDKGYFLMIEASRIDHAGHANDAAGHVHDALMFNEVMAYLKSYVAENPDTQLLSAADHECGGLTLPDGWDPTVVARAQNSAEFLAAKFTAEVADGDDVGAYLRETLLPLSGMGETASDEDVAHYVEVYESEGLSAMGLAILLDFAQLAGVNWSTGGHTAADVQLHGYVADKRAYEYMKHEIGFNKENTQLAKYVEKVLGLDLNATTDALREDGVDWVEKRDMLAQIKRDAHSAKLHAHHS